MYAFTIISASQQAVSATHDVRQTLASGQITAGP